jgi:hypothetical protein
VDGQPSTPPRCHILRSAPAKLSFLLAAMVVLMTSKGWPRVVTSNMFRPAPKSKLLNLMGFFSSLVRCMAGTVPASIVDMLTG